MALLCYRKLYKFCLFVLSPHSHNFHTFATNKSTLRAFRTTVFVQNIFIISHIRSNKFAVHTFPFVRFMSRLFSCSDAPLHSPPQFRQRRCFSFLTAFILLDRRWWERNGRSLRKLRTHGLNGILAAFFPHTPANSWKSGIICKNECQGSKRALLLSLFLDFLQTWRIWKSNHCWINQTASLLYFLVHMINTQHRGRIKHKADSLDITFLFFHTAFQFHPVDPPTCRPLPPPPVASWCAGLKSQSLTGMVSFLATRFVCAFLCFPAIYLLFSEQSKSCNWLT